MPLFAKCILSDNVELETAIEHVFRPRYMLLVIVFQSCGGVRLLMVFAF